MLPADTVCYVTSDSARAAGEADGHDSFSADRAARVLEIACDATGVDAADAELVRLGENAIFRLLSQPLIVRIARTIDYLPDVRTEVAVARWLESAGFAAVRLAGPADQPVVADGLPVTFWELLGDGTDFGTVGELAALLRQLHGLELPSSLVLPQLQPFGRVETRIAGADLAADDKAFLLSRLAELRERYAELIFVLRPGPIHGDANIGNILRRESDGVAVLIDLDGFASGPREWDLVLTAMYYERFGWHTGQEYHQFAETYGFDVMGWRGYPVLRDIRELLMVAWLAQNTRESTRIADEVAKRIGDLRRGDGPREWAPF